MRDRYLEVTFRKGTPVAAYLYFSGPRQKSVRTEEKGPGVLVDYAETGKPVGLEILFPGKTDLSEINRVLVALGEMELGPEEGSPLKVA